MGYRSNPPLASNVASHGDVSVNNGSISHVRVVCMPPHPPHPRGHYDAYCQPHHDGWPEPRRPDDIPQDSAWPSPPGTPIIHGEPVDLVALGYESAEIALLDPPSGLAARALLDVNAIMVTFVTMCESAEIGDIDVEFSVFAVGEDMRDVVATGTLHIISGPIGESRIISNVAIEYIVMPEGETPDDSDPAWSTTMPSVGQGEVLWQRVVRISNGERIPNEAYPASVVSDLNAAVEYATQKANEAKSAASRANGFADDALYMLGVIEDVAGILGWIQEHGSYTPTDDTEVVGGKYYFVRSGDDPDYIYTVVADPVGNPSEQGWYELLDVDEAVGEFVLSHLSLTSEGLWVLPSDIGSASHAQYADGYKMLLGTNGARIYNGTGTMVASYGDDIMLGTSSGVHMTQDEFGIKWYDGSDLIASIQVYTPGNSRLGSRMVMANDDTNGETAFLYGNIGHVTHANNTTHEIVTSGIGASHHDGPDAWVEAVSGEHGADSHIALGVGGTAQQTINQDSITYSVPIESSGNIGTEELMIARQFLSDSGSGDPNDRIMFGWSSTSDARGIFDKRTGKWLIFLNADDEVRTGISSYIDDLEEKSGISDTTLLQLRGWGAVFTFGMIGINLTNNLADGGSVRVCTIPSGRRPKFTVYGQLIASGHDLGSSYVRITTAGAVEIVNASGATISTSWNLASTITYVA